MLLGTTLRSGVDLECDGPVESGDGNELDCVVENNGGKNVLASESSEEGNPPRCTQIGCTRVWDGPVNHSNL